MLGTITITVGQRDAPNVILKEESAENMETKTPESADKTYVDGDSKDSPDADEQLPTPEEKAEEQELPGESSSNDVGFKKVFKFVGFKFTVRKDKTEKSEPVQLLNVKTDETEVTTSGAGDYKEVKLEVVEEAIKSEVSHPVEKTEQQTQTEQVKEETSFEKIKESSVEPIEASKEAEIKSDSSKLLESPTSPLANETASPLRKFFTQGWAGFRKKTSFRKPKEDGQPVEKEKQDQEKEMAEEENAIKEELEKEKTVLEKDEAEISVEPIDETEKKETQKREEDKMRDVSTETHEEEPITSPSQEYVKCVNEESEICLTENIGLASKEKSEPVQECLPSLDQSSLALSEKKHATPLAKKVLEEKSGICESASPLEMEKTEEHFEMLEDKLEPKAPLATESFDEIPTTFNNDVSTIVKREEVKINEKEEFTNEQLVETDAQTQKGQYDDEQLKVRETVPVAMNEEIMQTEPNSGDAATSKPPESITNEAELLSSQERAKIQGSPLKKLFTSTSLKKLSGKKNKTKREESKSGESVEQTQQLSDSAESPEEQKGESSASSPEETIELSSAEKGIDVVQITETEDGATSDMEKKRESVTPWASFKKMVTPKKRVRRLSESDKEEEVDKVKSATLSSTESAPCEEQEDNKENGEEQKLEKSTDEPKRKVDTSVSWEALICVGSSKKRARKSSSSDEEVGQRLAQEGQKIEESGAHKETVPDMTFTSSQESDQGQGNSSPEQAGSPSESEGVSTWESFKRLVTPRRKSKTKMEDRTEEVATVPSSEHSASDGDSGKEESWVSFKKLMPGRRKKKSDGIPEHAPVEEVGEEITENIEEDYDVPAVVPLSEYEAAEQEKFEAQKKKDDMIKRILDERTDKSKDALVDEQSNEQLVHAVTVTVVEGERAVTSIEERSPSWISAAMTESIEHADKEKQTEQTSETGIGEDIAIATKHVPVIRKDISGDMIISEMELTPEAITAREEASGVEEITEVSCAEETTEMVSAVSRLSESPDTTEIATPVQEVEGQQNLEELNNQTQEVLQEVAERVKFSDEAQLLSEKVSEIAIQSTSVEKRRQEINVMFPEAKLADSSLKIEDPEEIGIQINEDTEGDHTVGEVKESDLKEMLEKSRDSCAERKEQAKESLHLDMSNESETEQEKHEEITKEQRTEEKSEEEDFVFITITAGEEPEIKVGETGRKQQHIPLEALSEESGTIDAEEEITVNLEETAHGKVTEEGVTEVDESMKGINVEKTEFSQNLTELVAVPDLESGNAEIRTDEVKKALMLSDVKDAEQFIQPTKPEELVPEVPVQSQAIDVPVQNVVNEVNALDITKDVTIGLETKSTEQVVTGAYLQDKDLQDTEALLYNVETETSVQKMEPGTHLQKVEIEIPVENVKSKPHLLNTETQIHIDTVETGISIRKMEVEIYQQNSEIEVLIQKVETESHKEVETESCLPNVQTEVLAEKAEVKMEVKISTERAKADIPTEKAKVLTEEVEPEVPEEKTIGKVYMQASAEKTDAKMDVDASAAKVVEVSVEKEATAFRAEDMEAEVAEEVEMKVSGENVDMKDLTEDTKVESPMETIEVLTEEAKVDILSEMEDAMVNTRVLIKNINVEAPAEKSKKVVEREAAAKLAKQKEILQNMETEDMFQSETEDTMNAIISLEVPVCAELPQATEADDKCRVTVQSGIQDVANSFQVEYLDSVGSEGPFRDEVKGADFAFELTSTEQAVNEELVERETIKVSIYEQDAVDFIPNYTADGKVTLESPKTKKLEDSTFDLESECTEEIVTETSLQKGKNISFMEIEGEESKSMDSAASEIHEKSEKANALALKSNFTEAELTEKNKATVESVENDIGNTELATESKHREGVVAEAVAKTEVEGEIVVSESKGTGRVSETYEKIQVPSEKVIIVETDRSVENSELAASGDILYAAPMQQHLKQQEVVPTDIPEMQSYEAYKSSVVVTAAAVEEQIIEESVIVTETSTETLQSFLEESKGPAFKIVQQVTFVHSGLGAPGSDTEVVSWTEKRRSATEKPGLPDDDLTQMHVFGCTSKTKSELSQEKQVQAPESSPSLTHPEFQKDDVQHGTIESQSTKIVLSIIQNAVDKLEKTEETPSASSLCENKSEIQESIHTNQQLIPVNLEKHETLTKEENVPCEMSEDGGSWDPRKADTDLEAVKHMPQPDEHLGTVTTLVQDHGTVNKAEKKITEEPGLQKENGETMLESEMDAAVLTETERMTVEGIVSGDLPKESLDIDQPKSKGVEAGQTVQMQKPFVEQQTRAKRKDRSTGLEETHREEDVNDCMSCESLLLKSELAES
ncbi:A-kinase anchor protein 12 isoform X2 [Sphaerodactylus townsendi]|uniref:A-kinase anchor protein 12 isoform X2 n=1 Tax=Sphaerodactylus townsendi TaxID=933632 RepID=UPI0020266372|nr:A-kinase anchor protein 12 isoform X2 [Sphaerodactylus townsendi]